MGFFNKNSIHDIVPAPKNDPSFASQALFQELRHRVFMLADLRSSPKGVNEKWDVISIGTAFFYDRKVKSNPKMVISKKDT